MDQHVNRWAENNKASRTVLAITVAAPNCQGVQCVIILHHARLGSPPAVLPAAQDNNRASGSLSVSASIGATIKTVPRSLLTLISARRNDRKLCQHTVSNHRLAYWKTVPVAARRRQELCYGTSSERSVNSAVSGETVPLVGGVGPFHDGFGTDRSWPVGAKIRCAQTSASSFTLPMTACPPSFTWTCSTRTIADHPDASVEEPQLASHKPSSNEPPPTRTPQLAAPLRRRHPAWQEPPWRLCACRPSGRRALPQFRPSALRLRSSRARHSWRVRKFHPKANDMQIVFGTTRHSRSRSTWCRELC